MQFSKLSRKPGTSPAAPATPATPPKEVEAEVVETPKAQVPKAQVPATAAAAATALTLFDEGNAKAETALIAAVEASASEPQSPFPILQISGGEQGGMIAPLEGTPDDIAKVLPQGRVPLDAVFLGWRVDVLGWPKGYDDRDTDDNKPAWSFLLTANAPADEVKLVIDACEAYQFTGKDKKALFDFGASGVGHLRPSLQLMLFLPNPGGIVVLQLPQHLTSWTETNERLIQMANPSTHVLGQFPVTIKVDSRPQTYKNGMRNKVHRLEFVKRIDEQGKGWWDAWQAYKADLLANDAEGVASIRSWLAGVPMSDEVKARFVKAKTVSKV